MAAERSDDGSAGASPTPIDDGSTGLPLLRTWRAVYVFVVVAFLTWVALLTALDWVFS
jgi:hypothetical protein